MQADVEVNVETAAALTGFGLSPQQRRLWALLQGRGLPARIAAVVRLDGELDRERLRRAVTVTVERHEVLRTVFRRFPGMDLPLQVIEDLAPVWGPVHDLTAADPAIQAARLGALLDEARRRPADLARGPLLEVSLAVLAADRHALVLALPALLADTAGLVRLVDEIGAAYGGEAGEIGEGPLQYVDLADWQNELLAAAETAEAREHWLRQDLSGLARTRLGRAAAAESAAAAGPFVPREVAETVPPACAARLRALARELAVPFQAVLLALCRALVFRLAGEGEPVLGVAYDGRRYAELEGALGLFVRYLPLRGEVASRLAFRDLVRQEAEAVRQAHAWQESFVWPETPEAPVFPLVFDYAEIAPASRHAGLGLALETCRDCPERFEARFSWVERAGELRLAVGFDPEVLDAAEAGRLAGRLRLLADGAAADPDAAVGSLDLVGEVERHLLLTEWNDTAADLRGDRCLHEMFAEQAARTPDAIAAVYEGERLTYRDLDARAERLARRLRRLGVGPDLGPESRVGILQDRSLDLLVSLLGVLKAGGAYVPLDPEYPAERLAFMLEDSRPRVVLADRAPAGGLPLAGALVVDPRQAAGGEDGGGEDGGGPQIGPDHLAYVIYTSGSTGRPKGVMISHRAIANRLLWMQRRFPLAADDAVLQKTPVSFDASVWELFVPLLSGARVVFARQGAHRDPAALAAAVQENDCTVLQLVPSQLAVFLAEPQAAACTSLRRLFCGGEVLPGRLAARLREVLDVELTNLYGPTESSIDASFRACGRAGDADDNEGEGEGTGAVPIGRPLDNVRLYLLDAGLAPVPAGVAGEVHIGGTGLARGYSDRPALTAERFIPSLWGGQPGARLYRTGDLARHLPGGEIEFLGRLDNQVKVRGFRIELGEIETVLAALPGVQDAVVTVRDDALVAYAVPRGEAAAPEWVEGLRALLQSKLPPHMVPSLLVPLAALPLAPNGKVDRRALPAPDQARPGDRGSAAPRTVVEELIAGIWADVLAVATPGADDDFFALGGHSLVATQVVSRVRGAFRVELPLHALFANPTVARLAAVVEQERRAGGRREAPPILPVPRDGDLPLSFAQQRLWFLDHYQPGESTYNIPTSARLSGRLDVAAFARALGEIVRRHEILRTVYPGADGRPRQVILPVLALPLPVLDLRALVQEEREPEARRLAAAVAWLPLPLATGPLLRPVLFRLDEEEHVIVCVLHHIVSDAWSAGVLMRELSVLYDAFGAGRPSPLPELPVQYADFASWQRAWLQGEVLAEQLAYWRRLEGAPPLLELRSARPRPEVQSSRGATRPLVIPAELADPLRALARREGATLFMVLLAAFEVLLHHDSGQEDLVVGTDIANRNRVETEGLIGFFVNQLVLRTDLSGDPTFRALLARVREVTLGAYEHQDTPFEQVLELLKPRRTLRHAPLFQVKLFLLNTPAARFELPGLVVTPFGIDNGTSRLDLIVAVSETPEGLGGWVNYSTSLFDTVTIDRLMARFAAVLRQIAEDPDETLGTLCARLNDLQKEQEMTELRQREESKLKKFRRVQRSEAAAGVVAGELVTFGGLDAGGAAGSAAFPLVVRPKEADFDLIEWAADNRDLLEARLVEHGAVLFRGFEVSSPEVFERFAGSLCNDLFRENGEHQNIGGNVFVPVFYPPDKQLLWHNENSFNHDWPTKIWFCCATVPQRGGETPIVDSRQVFQRLDPAIRRRFLDKGVMYVRNYSQGLGLDWQTVFRTDDPARVEEVCRQEQVSWEWKDGGRLCTRSVRPAVVWHPRTGEPSWFNQAQHWHPACLDPETRAHLSSLLAEEDMPRHCHYGDGSPIEDSVMAEILGLYRELEVSFPWRRGDILMLDNILTAHGRNPFAGERRILVAMGEMRAFEPA